MSFETTYKLAQGPPAVDFTAYSKRTMTAWRELLDGNPTEPVVQRFLEKHPALVPGTRSPGAATSAYPLFNLLISQPPLPGLDGRRPDFLWFSATSDTLYPVLIEIETPSKRLFRSDGVPTATFAQARNQLNQWRTWFREPVNRLKFQQDYGVPDLLIPRRTMSLHMILIYGRRAEFEHDARLRAQRGSLLPGPDEELMSFDRLVPDPFLDDAITVRAAGYGRYRAVYVPPTFKLGPWHTERLLLVDGLIDAIDSSEGWAADRRSFVKQRIPYWHEWAKMSDHGWITGGEE